MSRKAARSKPTVVIGLLGPTLDAGFGPKRWERWRPTVCACQQPELPVSRFVLLYQDKFQELLARIIDDIATVSPETVVEPVLLPLQDPWDFAEVYNGLHAFSRSLNYDTDRFDYLVHITTGTHVAQICLFLLTESRHLPGRLLQTSPGSEREDREAFVRGSCTIVDLDLSKYDAIASRLAAETVEVRSFLKAGIDTRNPAFNRLIDEIEYVALHSQDPLLLIGPTGAGKSQLARRIYELRKLRHQLQGTYVEANCATIRGDGAMSTLFGHVKGAFTGAAADRPGLLRSADRGLLFLDEIGELGSDEQAMLLRALEEHLFCPLGSDHTVRSEFQLIAATNRDLRDDVQAGRFRGDLLARIDLWTFNLPGLRERPEDIAPNVAFELERFAEKNRRQVRFTSEAETRYLSFAVSPEAAWSGNFRDLAGSITRMATLAPGGRIRMEDVERELARLRRSWAGEEAPRVTTDAPQPSLVEGSLGPRRAGALDDFDRVQLEHVLSVCRRSSSISEAGRILFASSRTKRRTANDADRLRKYLARFDLDFRRARED